MELSGVLATWFLCLLMPTVYFFKFVNCVHKILYAVLTEKKCGLFLNTGPLLNLFASFMFRLLMLS